MPTTSKSETLTINDISISYGHTSVVHDISLSVKTGEFFGLIGLNGAGKTTLIKAILALRRQDAGEINIFGEANTHKNSKAQAAYLPERFEPPWFLTGMEFLRFSMQMYNQVFDKAHAVEGAEKLALDPDALEHRVQTYSKGMRQKLGILATVSTGCSLLILDEPMSGLDPFARTRVKDMLIEGKSHDQTIFLSSHILADMDEICDRVAVLHEGLIQFVGQPEALKEQTSSENLERAFLHFIEKSAAA